VKILICCDTYFPSVGGVQIVLQQISERLSNRGHDITIATSKLSNRKSDNINGVKIIEFDISGNSIGGITGEMQKYRDYVLSQDYDVLLMKAAQSWSFDSIIDILHKIKKRKIFIPCGFSGLFYPYYQEYYNKMPQALKEFDQLIFYAENYASEIEFSAIPDSKFRERMGINEDDILLLTVGTFSGGKGHTEVAKAFELAKFDKPTTLILNGNIPDIKAKMAPIFLIKEYLKMGPVSMLRRILFNLFIFLKIRKRPYTPNWQDVARRVNSNEIDKKILLTNLNRKDLIQCFLNSDLFVFASNIEYSPLVLYESVAAGLPFLSVPVGNAEEIAKWTNGGIICPAESDINGRTTVDPQILANNISDLLNDETLLLKLSENGKKNWKEKFTWDTISYQYEKILSG
jgi:glycosyltransferase involved in cell wall biosynthesis